MFKNGGNGMPQCVTDRNMLQSIGVRSLTKDARAQRGLRAPSRDPSAQQRFQNSNTNLIAHAIQNVENLKIVNLGK